MMKIFISYGHDEHSPLIKKMAKDLKELGYDIWIDYDDLAPANRWEEEIEHGIRSANWVVVFKTNHSMRRPDGYCLDEISYARYHNKSILPIRIQNIAPPISIARIQWLDMTSYLNDDGMINENYYQERLNELDSILRGLKELEISADSAYHLLQYLNPLDNENYLTNVPSH